MDAERWAYLKNSFAELADLEPAERARRLTIIASSDPWLSDRLEELLSADGVLGSSTWPGALFGMSGLPEAVQPSETKPDPTDPFALIGRTVSHFRVQGVLGSGGMGVLYRAEDLRLGRVVALKFMLPQYSIDGEARDRFLGEARAASSLDHPNVCTIYEADETADGQLFMAMQCYEGETLKERIAARGPLTVSEAVEVVRQVLQGLEAAHAAGIVHRDLKPGNLMLTRGGPLKILDFGLAKIRDRDASSPELVPGTVAYMSPEQLEGKHVDARTDLWSTGVVLHESLTGRTPFGGGHELATVRAILVEDPRPLSVLRPETPPALEAIVQKLLRKQPDERYSTATEVLADLDSVGESHQSGDRRRMQAPSGPSSNARRALTATLGIAAAALVAVGVWGRTGEEPSSRPDGSSASSSASAPARLASIAVLPFEDLSTAADQEYFSAGITEEIIHQISRVEGLTVAASTSSARFRGRGVDVREVGRRLDVASVLEGSVRRDGQRMRLSVRLVSTESGSTLWSETYEREIDDVFAVQGEISSAIAQALRLRLTTPSTPGVGSVLEAPSVEAYELFLRGRFFANRRTEESLVRAGEYYRQAIEIAPDFARAHAGLAETFIAARRSVPAERFLQGREAALRALAIDSSLSEAHTAMGWIEMWYERDWARAEEHFQRALQSNPNYIWAHQWYAAFLSATGRLEEALGAMRAAQRIDPLSVATITHVGSELLWLRRYEEAIVEYDRALELNPEFFMAEWGRARALVLMGRPDEAVDWLQRDGTDYVGFYRLGLLGHAYAMGGRDDEARAILADLEQRRRGGEYIAPTELASIHIGLGEFDDALDWLELHEADRGARIFLKVDPMFDPVRASPRFVALLGRLGLD